MIAKEQRSQLAEQAERGKGVWTALFVPQSRVPHAVKDFYPKDAHVTLTYTKPGDSPVATVHAVCDAVEEVHGRWFAQGAVTGRVTGCGWFWRKRGQTFVALVNGLLNVRIDVRAAVTKGLRLRDVALLPDDYDFIPHITLDNRGVNTFTQYLAECPVHEIWFPTLWVCSGEVQVCP